MSENHLWLIPFLPVLGAGTILLLGKRLLRGQSHWPCIAGAVSACVLSLLTLFSVREAVLLQQQYVWFQAGSVQVAFSMRADALTAVMLVLTTVLVAASRMRPGTGLPGTAGA